MRIQIMGNHVLVVRHPDFANEIIAEGGITVIDIDLGSPDSAEQALAWVQNLNHWLKWVQVTSPVFTAAVEAVTTAVESYPEATAWVTAYVARRKSWPHHLRSGEQGAEQTERDPAGHRCRAGASNVKSATGASNTMGTWTFCGHWDNDRIVVEYALAGDVQDERIDTGYWEQGLWAASGSGETLAAAQEAVIKEYEGGEQR